MIETSIIWLRVAACLYAVGLLHSLLTAVRHSQGTLGMALGAFRIGVVLHGVAIIDLWMALGHVPVDNVYQSLSLCAFLVAAAFTTLEGRFKFGSASIALFPLVFGMVLAATTEQQPVVEADSASGLRAAWLVVHIVLVLAGYAALLFTGLSAIAYLVQERRLKTKQASALLERLPPLATLDQMISKSLGLGFAFLTLGLLFGILWAVIYVNTNWIANPSITISVFTWVLLLITMFLRTSAGWRGRKAAGMTLAVLGSSALTWVMHAGLGAALAR